MADIKSEEEKEKRKISIRIIPDQSTDTAQQTKKSKKPGGGILEDTVKSLGILLGATALSMLFYHLGFTDANIIMVYILGVLLTSIVTSKRAYSLIISVASVFIFNYLFTVPRFSLLAYGSGYPVTFIVMFLTALITGNLANLYKEQASESARTERRTKILFDTDKLLSKARNKNEIYTVAAEQLMKLLGRSLVIFDIKDGELADPSVFHSETYSNVPYDAEREMETAKWVLKNNHQAGATTDMFPETRCLYLAMSVDERVYGVIGIEAENTPLGASEKEILLSILGECAMALENEKNAKEKEEAAILAKSEQLRANLLRTISHDLRTPLTSISGNASNLLNNGDNFDDETKQRLYKDMYEESMWLISLVENLLSATKIEEGRIALRTSAEVLGDIVDEAVRHISRKITQHNLSVRSEDDLILVKADAKLVVQVIVNIVDNAIKYTPAGSDIVITMRKADGMAQVLISDNGPGIPDNEKQKIFERFYFGKNKIADNRRSLGLGLYLCKAIVEAHGGTINVADNEPKGTVFGFTLPLEEVILHE